MKAFANHPAKSASRWDWATLVVCIAAFAAAVFFVADGARRQAQHDRMIREELAEIRVMLDQCQARAEQADQILLDLRLDVAGIHHQQGKQP